MPHFHQGHQLVTRVYLMPQPNMFSVFIYFVLSHLNIHTKQRSMHFAQSILTFFIYWSPYVEKAS